MSDLISRQAAIDALQKCRKHCIDPFDSYHIDIQDAENQLSKVPTIQPVATDTNVGATISKFIDGLEEIFADLRERHVDDSVCGLCEYEGAYMGQSGDWCNECPGFDRDDCFKLSDETRKKWTDEIIKALPTVQPEPQWIPVERKLPEDYTDVLVWFEYFRYGDYNCLYQTHGIGTYVAEYNSWMINHESGWKDLRVIAWMPLPELYQEGAKD